MQAYASHRDRVFVSRHDNSFDVASLENMRLHRAFGSPKLRRGERTRSSANHQGDCVVGNSENVTGHRSPSPEPALAAPKMRPLQEFPAVPCHEPKIRRPMTVTLERAHELMLAIFETDDVEVAEAMIPSWESACTRYSITPLDLLLFAQDTQRYIDLQETESDLKDSARRTRALSAIIAVSGAAGLRTPAEVIAEGRRVNWTRMTLAIGDGALSVLAGCSFIKTSAAATHMVAQQALLHAASTKAAATTGAKLKGGALAAGAGLGAAVLASLTISAGVLSGAYWYTTIKAYRDAFDNELGRDAFLFHRLKVHGVIPGEVGKACNHNDLSFTSPNVRFANYLIGKRAN